MTQILIVDDNEQNLYLLQVLLQGQGYEVRPARNGIEALDTARREAPDLVITDILMPGMDGFSLCREWMADEQLRRIPLVFYTATYTDPQDEAFALSLGAARFIVKPTEPDAFVEILRQVLENHAAQQLVPLVEPSQVAEAYYRQYNEALIRKLEDKMAQLEEANRALELDIAARQRAEEALRESEEKFRNLAENANDGVLVATGQGIHLYANRRAAEITGYSVAELLAITMRDLAHPAEIGQLAERLRKRLAGEPVERQYETIIVRKDGQTVPIEVTGAATIWQGQPATIVVIRDVTERKRLEAEKEALAAQFYQAQKMESIGRLAGGIAHDLNNLLVPISGYAELGLMKLTPDHPLYADLQRIKAAADRAAALARQILAFSRQQIMHPRPLDLNAVIREFQEMLQRLIGEDVTLHTRLAPALPPILGDKGQLEQVLMNLAVNARDAMPDGGTLTIETALVTLDESYVARHIEARAGPHVMLAVSDTGHGMDAATRQRLFEPFFTTKPPGQGTGLGLATVFGIVKQHRGNIWVYSEPGRGATFKIYLPLPETPPVVAEPEPPATGSLYGTETVLVVEDDPHVRGLVRVALETYGYRILAAPGPLEGLSLATTAGPIHLLLTDVVMPQMNGRELYEQLALARPDLKVLYTSGYTDNVIAHRGILHPGTAFLQKPFTISALLEKVRMTLG